MVIHDDDVNSGSELGFVPVIWKKSWNGMNEHCDGRSWKRVRFCDVRVANRNSGSVRRCKVVAKVGRFQVGDVVVPRHRWAPSMRSLGVYRAVEYEILELHLLDPISKTKTSIQSTHNLSFNVSPHNVLATLAPRRRLIARFERKWPVQVSLYDASLFSLKSDVLASAIATLASTICVFILTFYAREAVSIYRIPSLSMAPTLEVGDALLVEKVSLRKRELQLGEIVLFAAPDTLKQRIEKAGGYIGPRDLFVKRVAALPGDWISVVDGHVQVNGEEIEPADPKLRIDPTEVPPGMVFVLGDNYELSLDSRYFGLLPQDRVIGRPLCRCFPFTRAQLLDAHKPR